MSVKNLLLAEPNEKVCDIMDKTIICVHTLSDKEDVAKDMNKYDFVTMPVVDDKGRLVGIVTFDDAIDVMQDEATEDIQKMAAITPSASTLTRLMPLSISLSLIGFLGLHFSFCVPLEKVSEVRESGSWLLI